MLKLILGAVVVGITLGLLGSGGSAITVPLLVYVGGHNAKVAIAESMAIVGVISFFAAIPYARAKEVNWFCVSYFGFAGILGTLVGAILGGYASDSLQLIVFGIVLLIAAFLMLQKAFSPEQGSEEHESVPKLAYSMTDRIKMITEGLIVGVVTGFVGVGGGFMIVPALVVLAKLPIRQAIGSSLIIIAAKSLIGFLKYQNMLQDIGQNVDWQAIVIFSVVGVAAGGIGSRLNAELNQKRLKQIFAVFLLMIGALIILKELVLA